VAISKHSVGRKSDRKLIDCDGFENRLPYTIKVYTDARSKQTVTKAKIREAQALHDEIGALFVTFLSEVESTKQRPKRVGL